MAAISGTDEAKLVLADGSMWIVDRCDLNMSHDCNKWTNMAQRHNLAAPPKRSYEADITIRYQVNWLGELPAIEPGDECELFMLTNDCEVMKMPAVVSSMECLCDCVQPTELRCILMSKGKVTYGPGSDWEWGEPQGVIGGSPISKAAAAATLHNHLDELKEKITQAMMLPAEILKPATMIPNAPSPEPKPRTYERPRRRVRITK